MRAYTIHKPTHKFIDAKGVVIAIGQVRGSGGSTIFLNRFENYKLVEKTYAVETCCMHLTNYNQGQETTSRNLESAWNFTFGPDVPPPVRVEKVDPSLKYKIDSDD